MKFERKCWVGMNRGQQVFIGLDAGTSGVRCICVSEGGSIVAECSADLKVSQENRKEDAVHEQSPDAWWVSACEVLQSVSVTLAASGISPDSIGAIAVDGTSGTLVCLDDTGRPLRPAIMYNDGRSSLQADELNSVGVDTCDSLGYRFAASFALPKALWIYSEEPGIFKRTRFFAHQADYLTGRLTGRFDTTDYNNALKTGYDVLEEKWPDWIARWAGIPERLPNVVAPGEEIGRVTGEASRETGLPSGLKVVAGTTDGMAGFLASGAGQRGDCNTTLGTTLVFKAVSTELVKDENGAMYSHKLPNGAWLPGAASNTGAAWISALFKNSDPAQLDRAAATKLPSDSIAYPLVGRGERFPFLDAAAAGFLCPDVAGVDAYAAYLQGTAFVERLAYEELSSCTGQEISNVYCTGGGTRSTEWTQIRSNVCNVPYFRPAVPEAAFGTAVLAAAGSSFGSIDSAAQEMVQLDETFAPDLQLVERYNEKYARFVHMLNERGYI